MLADFFETMSPFLHGQLSARDAEARLGPSPSGTDRLAFYAVLARRDVASVLRQLFPVTRAACGRDTWNGIEIAYLASHRSTHWEPNRFGQAFADFLADRRAHDGALAPWIEELADYEWTRFEVATSLEPEAHVRLYDHDVRAVHQGTSAVPHARPTVLLVHRAVDDRVVVETPDPPTLCAVARRAGTLRSLPAGVTEDDVERAERDLSARGVPCRLG